jgi:hypothetical protein
MLPLAQVPFAAFGALWYAQFCGDLCRALAAPWLDPWWFAKGMRSEPQRSQSAAPPTASEPTTQVPGEVVPQPRECLEPAVSADVPAADATVICFDLARARVAANRPASQRPRR